MSPASTARSTSTLSSSMEPITLVSDLSSVRQIGRGIPQKRERDKFQSLALASQFPKRPSPVDFGFQLILLFRATNCSFLSLTFTNQESSG